MTLEADKWQVGTDKIVVYTGGAHGTGTANYVSVLELHRWLQDLADDASVADHGDDDFMDITTLNPSDKKFDTIITLVNGYTLDTAGGNPAPEFIFGGSIIQGSGGSEVIYDGISVVGNRGVLVNVIQNNTVLANKFWNNVPNGESFAGLNPDPANGVAMRFMVKVKNAGSPIDNGALLFTTREEGKSFSEFRIPSTGRGVNVVPLTFTTDLNNPTDWTTISGWTTIANLKEGYSQVDVDQNSANENYYGKWDRDTGTPYTINQFYQRMKWLTRNGETTTIYGVAGEKFRGITHELTVTHDSGTFVEPELLTWSTGTGQLLAVDSTTASTKIYMQLLTGTAPSSGQVTGAGAGAATVSANTEKPVSTPFCGQSTGSSLVGAYGFTLEYLDLAVNDKITALDGVTRSPPNNVQFTVGGIQSGWRVLVGPEDGAGGLDYDQLSITTPITAAGVTSVTVFEAIPANTPAPTGTIRIERADGQFTRHPYSEVNTGTKTFTIASHDFDTNNSGTSPNNRVFISYIDAASGGTSISFNTVQSEIQTLYVEARYGGTPPYTNSIKPAKTTGSLTGTGGSATISSVSDA
jgi:hypothetical protein